MHKNIIKNKRGVTLIEIMTAILILAFAFLPIIGVIGQSSKDTDVSNSTVFAQTSARNILDTLLDEVPFNSIKATPTHIAQLQDFKDYKVDSFLSLIGSTDTSAQGEIFDERGNKYTVTIYVFPIPVEKSENPNVNTDLVFSYRERPKYEDLDTANWYTYNTDEADAFIRNGTDPYSDDMITTCATQTVGAYALGAFENSDTEEYFIMKKILLKLTWTNKDGHERYLELYTLKANLDSEA